MAQKTVTANGNAYTEVDVKKFGTASLYCDGASDYLSTPNDSVWDLDATESWTIDFWLSRNGVPVDYATVAQRGNDVSPYNGWAIHFADGTHYLRLINNATGAGGVVDTVFIDNLTWYHFAFVHDDAADTLVLYRDGSAIVSNTASTVINWTNTSDPLSIGTSLGFIADRSYNGYIDEFRISKGIARWTGNFTPPTSAYTADANTELLLHCDGVDGGTTFTDDSAVAEAAVRRRVINF